jgi:hypothetical protein
MLACFSCGESIVTSARRAAVVHHAHGQLLDARRKRGAEHHGLLALGRQLVDLGQIVGEAQVQHAVGFVDHQELHLVELDLHGALQIQQTARRGHHEVGVLQLGDLQLVGHAAHHVGNAQAAAVLDQVDGVVRHLLGQLTRGAQHQGAGHGSLEVAGLVGPCAWRAWERLATGSGFGAQALELGALFGFGSSLLLDQVCSTGSRKAAVLPLPVWLDTIRSMKLGIIAAAHGQGNGLELHGGGLGVAQVGHGLHQLWGQAQFDKAVRLGSDCVSSRISHHGSSQGFSGKEDSAGANSPCTCKVSVIFFSHETCRKRAPAVVSSMVKKHQPSNKTCHEPGRDGWAKNAKTVLPWQRACEPSV